MSWFETVITGLLVLLFLHQFILARNYSDLTKAHQEYIHDNTVRWIQFYDLLSDHLEKDSQFGRNLITTLSLMIEKDPAAFVKLMRKFDAQVQDRHVDQCKAAKGRR